LPILNNYPGWLAEIITKHHCGLVTPPDDKVAFANALEWAASNKYALKAMGKNGQMLAKSEFSRPQLAEKWVDWVTAGGV
jgi:glycosyltransferase involved in cell wall biosynthesis